MASLRAASFTVKPEFSMQERFALALMRAERQVSCSNCSRRLRPCKVFAACKEAGGFAYFIPKPYILNLQLSRVKIIIDEINKL